MRLDTHLFQNNLCKSRSSAQNLIKMGEVSVNGAIVEKSSTEISDSDIVEVHCAEFASLGVFKLEKAIFDFSYDCKNKVCTDIGASNGGFTEVLLKSGAKKVYAVDVGECALAEHLLGDERVVVKDKLNARYITSDDIGEKVDLAVVDVSFISLKLVLLPIKNLLKEGGAIIALVKPQFECQKQNLTKKGLVKSQKTVDKVLRDIIDFSIANGFSFVAKTEIPLLFKDKNTEHFIFLTV